MAQWYNDFLAQRPSTRSTGPTVSTPKTGAPFVPTGGSSGRNSGQFTERGAPEAFQLEQFVPENLKQGESEAPMANALDVALRSPAYTLERPIAAVDELTGIGKVAEAIPRVPIIGDAIDAVAGVSGDYFERAYEGVGAVMNAPWAQAIEATKDANPDDSVNAGFGLLDELMLSLQGVGGGFGAFLNPDDNISVADLEAHLKDANWTDQDFADLRAGRKGWLDMGMRTIPSEGTGDENGGPLDASLWSAINDMGTRVAADPMNLVFAPGKVAGLVGAAGRIASGGTKVKAGIVAQNAIKKAMPSIFRTPSAASRTTQAANIAAGSTEGVGVAGLSDYMRKVASIAWSGPKAVGRGGRITGNLGYKQAAAGTTAAQVSLNAIDAVTDFSDDFALQGLLNTAARIGERKPLSENDLFVMGSLFTVPGRTIASTVWNNLIKRPVQAGRKFTPEKTVAKALFPGTYKDSGFAAARAKAVERFGSEERFGAFMMQVLKGSFAARRHLETSTATLPGIFHSRSLAEVAHNTSRYNEMLTHSIRNALVDGKLTARDIRRGLEEFQSLRGGQTPRATGGLRQQGNIDAEAIFDTWAAWEPRQRAASELFGGKGSPFAVGIQDEVVLMDDLWWASEMVGEYATKGFVTGDDIVKIINMMPASMRHGSKTPTFLKAMSSTGRQGKYAVDDVLTDIENLKDVAVRRDEYFAAAEEWERLGSEFAMDTLSANNRIAAGGGLAADVSPAVGKADVSFRFKTLQDSAGAMAVQEARPVGLTRALRAHPDVVANSANIPRGLRIAGYGVESAVESTMVISTRGHTYTSPGVLLRMDPRRPLDDIMEAAVAGMETSGAPKAHIVLRGSDDIMTKGLTPNGVEHTFDVGRLTESEWDDLVESLKGWGDRANINDTEGIVKLIVPDGNQNLSRKLNKAAERMGKAVNEEPVHFRDIIKGKKKHDVPNGQYSYDELQRQARKSRRYLAARDYIDNGVAGYGPATSRASESAAAKLARQAAEARSAAPDGSNRAGTTLTRYESGRGRIDGGAGVRGRSSEYSVNLERPGAKAQWEDTLNQSGFTDTTGASFRFRDGDSIHVTPNGNAGAVVRANGEFIPWRRHPDRADPDGLQDVFAVAAEHATWARVLDPTDVARGGRELTVHELGDHGFFPVFRGKTPEDAEDILYLLRDPDGVASVTFKKNGYLVNDVRNPGMSASPNIVETNPQRARYNIEALSETLYPERAARAKQAVTDAGIAAKEQRLSELNEQIAKAQRQKKKTSDLVAQRDAIELSLGSRAAAKRRAVMYEQTIQPGHVQFVKGAEADARRVVPYMDESLEGFVGQLSDAEKAKVLAFEAEMRAAGAYVDSNGNLVNSANYTVKQLPQTATPYYLGQNEAYEWVMRGKRSADTRFRSLTAAYSEVMDKIVGPVYAKELALQTRQHMYDEFLQAGVEPARVNKFINALRDHWESSSLKLGGAKAFRSPEMQEPGIIRKIANGEIEFKYFKGFTPEELAQLGDPAALVQRSSSRFYRNLSKQYPAVEGQGNLGKLIDRTYGKNSKGQFGDSTISGVRKGVWAGSVGYNVLRFLLDPRWWAMNLFEADILGMARWGAKVRGVAGGEARGGVIKSMLGQEAGVPTNPMVEKLAGRRGDTALLSVEEQMFADRFASGWMDPRALYGYVVEAVKATQGRITAKTIKKMIEDGSPVIDDLKKLWGDNPEAWVDEIDRVLYGIDTKGIKATVMADDTAKTMAAANNPAYDEFMRGMFEMHRRNYQDIVHTFHGNINRSNLERLLNSPFLWWPLSYQLKTGKWLIDVMTKSFAGSKAELAGSGALFKLLQNHGTAMENNEDYRNMRLDHPAAWQALGMFLPITPFDLGVFMARWTRYAGSWSGAQLGLWDQDESYPQDPWNFALRSLALGPMYSKDVLERIFREIE